MSVDPVGATRVGILMLTNGEHAAETRSRHYSESNQVIDRMQLQVAIAGATGSEDTTRSTIQNSSTGRSSKTVVIN